MTLNEWAKQIHQNAVDHGWWDNERDFPETVALCHSELSEALEEDRKGEDLYYVKNGKPEGIATEMMDCVIRILDWFGSVGINPETILEIKHDYNKTRSYKHGKRY